jgi:hypothetical protein
MRFERTRTESAPVLPDLPGEKMEMERNYVGSDAAAVGHRGSNPILHR